MRSQTQMPLLTDQERHTGVNKEMSGCSHRNVIVSVSSERMGRKKERKKKEKLDFADPH
jgi:hypothetical protein